MNYKQIAEDMLKYLGGSENIQDLSHCFTRLRFVIRDESSVNEYKIQHLEGVISVVKAGGQFQVVCGAKVNNIYDELEQLLENQRGHSLANEQTNNNGNNQDISSQSRSGQQDSNSHNSNKKIGNQILQIITQIFTPLVPAIAAAGLIKGLLTALKLILLQYDIDITTTDTYNILFSASQVIFYFFPIFLAFTTAKALKCNQVIAMVIAGTLVYPAIDTMIQDVATKTTIFGLPVIKGAWQIGDTSKVFSYTESVIPIILAVLVMAYLEKLLKRWIPEIIQLIFIPGLELLIMIPLTLVILGPIGIYIGNGIQFLYDGIIGISPMLGGALIGGLWGVFVIFGAHRALLPIGLNDVALTGRQNILAFAGAANFAQGGAALGVLLKTKNRDLKQVAASGTIAAALVGVTEPAIYGCNLRLKKPMICAIIAGAVGGAIMGLGGVYGDAFANNGVLTIFTYAAFGMTKFLFYLIGILVAFVGAAALTYMIGFDEVDKESQKEDSIGKDSKDGKRISNSTNVEIKNELHADSNDNNKVDTDSNEDNELDPDSNENNELNQDTNKSDGISIKSFTEGNSLPLSEVKDPVFSSGDLGDGVAIQPTKGLITAPCKGKVTMLADTNHAIGLELDNGIELLIHVGINTVELNGKHFKPIVQIGDLVDIGTELLAFDIDEIKKVGYDLTTPMILTNMNGYHIVDKKFGQVNVEDELIILNKN